jgi:ketosteroid isomerase-like protein
MSTPRPQDVVSQLVQSINQGHVDAAVACYEPAGALVVQLGTVATGARALREALAGFIALKPVLTTESYQVILTGDIALYLSAWNLVGKDPQGKEVRMSGRSSDVLRRQPGGTWLIALDNPWGTSLLGSEAQTIA